MAQYGNPSYWDERYRRDPDTFDWYQRWNGVKDVVSDFVSPGNKLLNIGCGNSRMSEEMYDSGFSNITNVDVSSVVISAMQAKYRDRAQMTFTQMNCTNMSEFQDASYDVVIDKALLDAILCGEDFSTNVQLLLKEVSRVLKPNGRYIVISYGKPTYRLTYLKRDDYGWNVQIRTVKKPSTNILAGSQEEPDDVHFIYICTKSNAADAVRDTGGNQ